MSAIVQTYTHDVCERGDVMDSIEIGNRIRKLRESKGLSQKELAEKLGTSASSITMYECGKRIPRDELKITIARFFDKTIDSIFFE